MMLKQNKRLITFQFLAAICSILTFVFTFIPAYFESDKADLSLTQMAFGVEERLPFNGLLVLGFVLLAIGVVISVLLSLLLLKKDSKEAELIITIAGIIQGLTVLAGGIILACAIFITGLNETNSSLGFTQGNWGIRPGNILVPVFALLSFIFSYPCAEIILYRKDQEDQAKRKLS